MIRKNKRPDQNDPGVLQRRRRIITGFLLLLGVGGLYAGFVLLTGWGIPCPFHLLTGLQCPGCGVSRMCLALLRFDLRAAFRANAAILCLLPVMAVTAAQLIWLYIHRNKSRSLPTDILTWSMIGILLVFGVLRNIR